MLQVDKKDKFLGVTKNSTVGVDCVFVGQNEQRRDQWIFYVAIASTNWAESGRLMDSLWHEFDKAVHID